MIRTRNAQQLRQKVLQAAIGQWRAQAAEAQGPSPAAPVAALGAALATTYSIPEDKTDPIWKTLPRKQRQNKKTAYAYAKEKMGREPVGIGWDGLTDLFGDYAAFVVIDANGQPGHYIGNNTLTGVVTRTVGGARKLVTGVGEDLYDNNFNLAVPAGVVNIPAYLFRPGFDQGILDLVHLANQSDADRVAGRVGECSPWGTITTTQAKALQAKAVASKESKDQDWGGCLPAIAAMTGDVSAGEACPPGYAKSQICDSAKTAPGRPDCCRQDCGDGYHRRPATMVGGSPCAAGETWQPDPSNRACGRCISPECTAGYVRAEVECGAGYRREPDPNVHGCWACNAACPQGYGPPDQVQCPAGSVQEEEQWYGTGCVKCVADKPEKPVCPPGYYTLPEGAPFMCPPWQQRKVDEATGCVACETAANCFETARGLACGPGTTPQAYGAWTCCQGAQEPAPGQVPPSTEPAAQPEKPPGAEEPVKAGIGIGGGFALAAVAGGILWLVFKGTGGAEAAPPGQSRGLSDLRGRLPR